MGYLDFKLKMHVLKQFEKQPFECDPLFNQIVPVSEITMLILYTYNK